MENMSHLYGACACERNQYTVVIPPSSASLAQVFFDNSAANRRSQASPVTAWLRIPLDWYHSTTFAHFPDETHTSIRRTFNTPSFHPTLSPTRRQFCGYCGTHLTAWNEGHSHSGEYMNVTLGSLFNESIDQLVGLDIIRDTASDEDELVTGGDVNEEDHIPTNEEGAGGVDADPTAPNQSREVTTQSTHSMHNRGMPYFEEMVENSRLGLIKRQRGGRTSQDGRMVVQWEVIEIGGDDEPTPMETELDVGTGETSNKRQKVGE